MKEPESIPGPQGPRKSQEPKKPTSLDYHLAFEERRAREEGKSLCAGMSILCSSSLRVGDVVVVESQSEILREDTKGSFLFRITKIIYPNLGLGPYSPDPEIYGRLEGALVPDEQEVCMLKNKELKHSPRGVSIIKPGSNLFFKKDNISKDPPTEMPPTTDFAIAREENGVLKILKPSELGFHDKNIETNHNAHIEKVHNLMAKFGFEQSDFLEYQGEVDSDKSSGQNKDYEDETFLAHYSHGMADGNQLIIFNKKIRQMIICEYFNFNHENLLQVAYADLTDSKGIKLEKNYGGFPNINSPYHAGVPVVTYTSSPPLNLDDVVSYQPSVAEEADLGIPKIVHAFPLIDIQLWPGNNLRVESTGEKFGSLEKRFPGTLEKIRKMIISELSPDGRYTLRLGKKTIKIKSIEDVFKEILG